MLVLVWLAGRLWHLIMWYLIWAFTPFYCLPRFMSTPVEILAAAKTFDDIGFVQRLTVCVAIIDYNIHTSWQCQVYLLTVFASFLHFVIIRSPLIHDCSKEIYDKWGYWLTQWIRNQLLIWNCFKLIRDFMHYSSCGQSGESTRTLGLT